MNEQRTQGVETPWRFARSPRLKTWFMRGFQDALNDCPMYGKDALNRYFGSDVWEAYVAGHDAVQAWKAASHKHSG